MENTNKFIGYIALANLKGIGPAFMKKIAALSIFESPDVFEEIRKITLANNKNFEKTEIINSLESAKKIIEGCIREDIKILLLTSKLYPENLKNIKDPPPFIYCKGNLDLLCSDIVGIIGTREPTETGIEISKRVGNYYSSSGWTICNGLAEGVDSQSIGIASKSNRNIVGVLAGGLNFNSEKTLLKKTAEVAKLVLDNNGLLLCEANIGVRENTFSVVKSCRIQAGISKGLILVQSSMKGGSRFTVKSFCETQRPLGIIYPIAKDYNLPSYEANKKIIEENEAGLSEFTGIEKNKLNSKNIFFIKSKVDFSLFEEQMRTEFSEGQSGNLLF